jgi:hypothetical protein
MNLKKHKRVERALHKPWRRLFPDADLRALLIWVDLDDATPGDQGEQGQSGATISCCAGQRDPAAIRPAPIGRARLMTTKTGATAQPAVGQLINTSRGSNSAGFYCATRIDTNQMKLAGSN